MPKRGITKTKLCISIDNKLHFRLKNHCNQNLIKLSTYLEYLIKKGLETKDKVPFNEENSKIKITISLDKELHSKLKNYCGQHLIKLSTYLEYLIKKGEKYGK
tara:strand:+ start:230 stop:538 length:309 start_codon:yes stop_codon:yes gene_type:complete